MIGASEWGGGFGGLTAYCPLPYGGAVVAVGLLPYCLPPTADCFLGGEEIMLMPGQGPPAGALTQPWRLPPRGLAVFHGERHAPRLSHYFMPRLALEGRRILLLDGANCADPRLMARLAERRGMPFAQFNQHIMIARAFTCFQLTELISRVPQFLAQFPAQVVMVTAFPELYFDEDVRLADASAAFQQALGHLRRWGQNEIRKSKFENREREPNFEFRVSSFDSDAQPLSVALFSAATGFQPPAGRQRFFAQTCAAATELWRFQEDGQGRLSLTQQTEGAGVARTPVFGVRGSYLATTVNPEVLLKTRAPEPEGRRPASRFAVFAREEPRTPKTGRYNLVAWSKSWKGQESPGPEGAFRE